LAPLITANEPGSALSAGQSALTLLGTLGVGEAMCALRVEGAPSSILLPKRRIRVRRSPTAGIAGAYTMLLQLTTNQAHNGLARAGLDAGVNALLGDLPE
jgi:hypothetical protein